MSNTFYKAQIYAFKVTAVVSSTAWVRYQNIDYSVPAECIGQEITLHLQQQAVSIYFSMGLMAYSSDLTIVTC